MSPNQEAAGTKPCEIPCPKCGSTDIWRQFLAKGQAFDKSPAKKVRESKWLKDESHWTASAKKDCIDHHCRRCQFEWESDPLKTPTKTSHDQ